jgi:hypothetical protein
LACLARNSQALQTLLAAVSSAANCLSLQFRPDKCARLSMAKTTPRIQLNQFQIQTKSIPALQREDHYRYLGVPIGLVPNRSNHQNLVDDLATKLDKIERSLLAPWQKLDAIRTFIQPCLTYALRSAPPIQRPNPSNPTAPNSRRPSNPSALFLPVQRHTTSSRQNKLVASPSLTLSKRTMSRPSFTP